MDQLISFITSNIHQVDWEGPAAFVVAILAVFTFFRRFSLVLLILLIIVLGWGAENLIVTDLSNQERGFPLPLIIYCRPPEEKIFNFGDREQMYGVFEKRIDLLFAYDTPVPAR